MNLLLTDDGKRVKIDLSKDLGLFKAPHNPPNTGNTYTAGTDLLSHKTRKGNWYYYLCSWSMRQDEPVIELISKNEAISFLLEKVVENGDHDYFDTKTIIEHFGGDIFEEDA